MQLEKKKNMNGSGIKAMFTYSYNDATVSRDILGKKT